jgi:hypothetical protein
MPDLISFVYPDQYVKLRGSDKFLRNTPGREMDAMTVAWLDIPFPLGLPKTRARLQGDYLYLTIRGSFGKGDWGI